HQMVLVESLNVGGNFASPRRRWHDLVAGLPAEDCRLVMVDDAGVRVFSCQQIADSCFEVADNLRIAPKGIGWLAAESRVFANATPPLGLIDEGNNDSNPF